MQDSEYMEWIKKDKEHQAKAQSKAISLQDCLKEFTKEEIMGEEDTFYCSACKTHQRITKTIDIWSAPEVIASYLYSFLRF